MERIRTYLEIFYLNEYKQKGFFYLPDDDLLVTEKLLEKFNTLNLKANFENRETRINTINNIVDSLKSKNVYSIQTNTEKNKLITLCNYQIFLDENNLDGRSKNKIRDLLTNNLLNIFFNVKVERKKYFYNSSLLNLNFIDKVSDLIDKVNQFEREELEYFFRGHSNIDWTLVPSIYRKKNCINNEHNIYRDLILRNSEAFLNTRSTFEKLTKMQHHGLPTRLLDITKNPLVALYFVCSDNNQLKYPGEIIVFQQKDRNIKFYDSDTVSMIANLAKADRSLVIKNSKSVFNSSYQGQKLLHLIKEEKPYFLPEMNPQDFKKAIIVKPINNNERIKRQLGYFFLFGIDMNLSTHSQINSIYKLKNRSQKFIIEEKNKQNILKELDSIGISMNTLFPEIDDGAEYLKSKY